MVRLKVCQNRRYSRIVDISIPYGAIKRLQAPVNSPKIARISIPYGAIKSFIFIFIWLQLHYFNSLWCD